MVLFLYVIMLMNLNSETEKIKSRLFLIMAAITGGSLLLIITAVINQANLVTVNDKMFTQGSIGTIKLLGKVLYTDYILPFEVASILFLVAMIGAVVLGRKEEGVLTVGNKEYKAERNITSVKS